MNKNVKISVIVPVYNVEAYLSECLESILQQSMTSIEVICVNDGSPDNSLSILNTFADKDNRVTVITQENQGVSVARNTALEVATGEFIYFMDSDDLLSDETAFEQMVSFMDADNLDVLSFNSKSFGLSHKDIIFDIPENVLMTGKEYLKYVGVHVALWSRLFRKSVIDEIDFSFIAGYWAEDAEAIPRLMYASQKVKHIKDQFLLYRVRENSLMTSKSTQMEVDGLALTAETYWSLSQKECDESYSRFLFLAGLEFMVTSFIKNYLVGDIENTKIKYENIYNRNSFSWLEKKLLKNEESYIKHVVVDKNSKYSDLKLYIIRRVRVTYYKKLRKYP